MKNCLLVIAVLLSGYVFANDDPVRPELYRYLGDDKDLGNVELLLFKNAEKKISGYIYINGTQDTLTSIKLVDLDFTFSSKKGWKGEGKDLTEDDIKVTIFDLSGDKHKVKMVAKEADNGLKMTGDYTYRSGPFTDETALIIYQTNDKTMYFSLFYQTKNMVYKKKYVDQWGYAKKIGPNTFHIIKPIPEEEDFYCDFTFKKEDNGRIIFMNNSNCAECLYGLQKGDKIYFETGDE